MQRRCHRHCITSPTSVARQWQITGGCHHISTWELWQLPGNGLIKAYQPDTLFSTTHTHVKHDWHSWDTLYNTIYITFINQSGHLRIILLTTYMICQKARKEVTGRPTTAKPGTKACAPYYAGKRNAQADHQAHLHICISVHIVSQ